MKKVRNVVYFVFVLMVLLLAVVWLFDSGFFVSSMTLIGFVILAIVVLVVVLVLISFIKHGGEQTFDYGENIENEKETGKINTERDTRESRKYIRYKRRIGKWL